MPKKYRYIVINGQRLKVRKRPFMSSLEDNIFQIGCDRKLHLKDIQSRKIITFVQARGL